jgi:hypothetical protein
MAKKRAAKQVRARVRMTVGTPMQIPSGAKEGVQFTLGVDGEKLGDLKVTGAHVQCRRKNGRWQTYNFGEIVDLLG